MAVMTFWPIPQDILAYRKGLLAQFIQYFVSTGSPPTKTVSEREREDCASLYPNKKQLKTKKVKG